MAACRELFDSLDARGWSSEAAARLHRGAHSLAGAGSTFGRPEVSAAARGLAAALRSLIEAGREPEPAAWSDLAAHLAALEKVAGGGAPSIPTAPSTSPRMVAVSDGVPAVVVATGDPETDAALATALGRRAQSATIADSGETLRAALRQASPTAAICELDLLAEALDEPSADQPGPPLLLVVVADRADLASRLQAVRYGSIAFVPRPPDRDELVRRLESLLDDASGRPRVLVVDDDVPVAEHYVALLRHAGVEARMAHEGATLLALLADFRPELILMDLYMPNVLGWELAAVIRQQETLAAVPILFLSDEHEADRQLAAMTWGADGFLGKSLSPEQLLAAVRHRLWRGRRLNRLISLDSLTGLLDRGAFSDRAAAELERARRHASPMVYAILDLDRFKAVNDGRGHTAGDRVLASLATHLLANMRATDVVGRLGGEEFGVVFADTDEDAGRERLDELRRGFAALEQRSSSGPFHVTFSAGMAMAPRHGTLEALHDAADAALYAAKRAGRDRVAADGQPEAPGDGGSGDG